MKEPAARALRKLTASLESTTPIVAASAISLALGLCFIFIWSPLPWGWLGIDHYDDRALRLAAGEPFDTTDVPWGYAYYLAAFYALFGHHPWLPLVFQAILNACVPALLYGLVRPLTNQRTAVLSALLTGLFSFNTVYVATQSSDAICTVLVLGSLLLFERGKERGRAAAFAASGLLIGTAVQFRPNLILLPLVLALAFAAAHPISSRLRNGVVYLSVFALMLMPWIVRNYQLTRSFLPTSTHGGVQLWYGTLQAGEYLENRGANPRRYFEPSPFDYTSLEGLPILVWAHTGDCDLRPELLYWTSRNPQVSRLQPSRVDGKLNEFWIPGQPSPTTINFYFEATRSDRTGTHRQTTPAGGAAEPFVYFVSTAHLQDLDTDRQLLDVFDVARLVSSGADPAVHDAVNRLVAAVASGPPTDALVNIERASESAVLTLADGSTLAIPRDFGGIITDLDARGELASRLLYARVAMTDRATATREIHPCGHVDTWGINDVFYRKEPHMMRRYTALALDNIGRDPLAFAAASAYRMIRVFVIRGSDDAATTQQFASSRAIYAAGSVLSFMYFSLFVAGAWIALRRRLPVRWLLIPVLYVPLTICFMLTNMRYSITVQPYVLTFVAIAILAALEKHDR
jgi:hypothetical protein